MVDVVRTRDGQFPLYGAAPAHAVSPERWKGLLAWYRVHHEMSCGIIVWFDGNYVYVYDSSYVRAAKAAGDIPHIITGPAPRHSTSEPEVTITFTTHVQAHRVQYLQRDVGVPDGVSIAATLDWLDKRPAAILCDNCACEYDEHSQGQECPEYAVNPDHHSAWSA